MRHFILLFGAICLGFTASDGYAATSRCSKMNLTRCLDSVCAINANMNPSARCQYCGTSGAGEPPSTKGIAAVTAGQSTKYALSDKELAVAPSDPGKRYVWATTECIKKLPDCTPDDASTAYDKLIEQSCKNAGIAMQIAATTAKMDKKKSKSSCNESISTCMNKKCGESFDLCPTDADLDRVVAECGVDTGGCDEYLSEFRKTFAAARNSLAENRDVVLTTIVEQYQKKRDAKMNNAKSSCTNGTASDSCVEIVCQNNMRDKCKDATEISMAKQLCKFYETACTVLR